MKIFVSGGCKNGKSHYAQRLAQTLHLEQRTGSLYYIATMNPVDTEDNERIARHRREREGWGFSTIEQPFDIAEIPDKCCGDDSLLLDSLTALLANEMFLPDSSVNEKAADKISAGLRHVLQNQKNIVIVSDYIYSDALLYDQFTEKYRKSLAEIDRTAAQNCDAVLEISCTNVIVHKGKNLFEELRNRHEKIF